MYVLQLSVQFCTPPASSCMYLVLIFVLELSFVLAFSLLHYTVQYCIHLRGAGEVYNREVLILDRVV